MGKATLVEVVRNEDASISVDGRTTLLCDRDAHEFNDDRSDIIEVDLEICGVESRIIAKVPQSVIDEIYFRVEECFEIV